LINKKINIAFLGGGINSAVGRAHRIAIDMDKRYELVAGCFSRNSEINLLSAKEYSIDDSRIYCNLDELILNEKDKIDAICILTPTPNHKDEVLKCLENDISVICEKALAQSSKDIIEIKEMVDRKNGFLVVTYNYTGYPLLRELKNMITSGKLGKINQIHIEMPQESFIKVDKNGNPFIPQNWRLTDNKNLPIMSLDLGTHTHDLTSFLTGEKPLELIAVQNSFGAFEQVIDNSISIAKYTNNIVSNIWFSKSALGYRNGLRVRIFGDKGSAEWYQLDPENLYFNDNKGKRIIIDRGSIELDIANQLRYNRFKAGHPSGFIEAFANHYYDIADYLLKINNNENRYVFDIEDALEGIKMLEAMTISNKEKSWVKI
jgi:predicted dehydrogenase